MKETKNKNLEKRPPIVVVMGHVDHGKTTLLDYIRKTNLATREAGGITQSIGAYEITHNNQKITFIDTPGHEAFSKMRGHGARAADLAILVVAAEDGVKPQTKEAFQTIQKEKIPFVVAINKIDKPSADIQKTKQDLGQNEIFLEGFGGTVSWQAISAKTGEGVNELLDLVLLASELENLNYDPNEKAAGVILSVRSDRQRGILTGAIVKNGKLKNNDLIATPSARGKARALENFLGQPVKSLEPSSPVLILGFEKMPQIGEEFSVYDKLPEETRKIERAGETELNPMPVNQNGESVKLNLVLKSEEAGSLEALRDLVKKSAAEIPLNIAYESVGNIHENDVKLALSANATIIGFKIKIDKAAQNMARAKKVLILNSPVIYELEKAIKEYGQKMALKEVRSIEILAAFGKPKGKERIVGGRVILGPIKNQEKFEIWQGSKMLGEGKILNLQSQKKDAPEVQTKDEVGLLAESEEPIKIGSKLLFL